MCFPSRYVDKTKFHRIRAIGPDSDTVQLKGILRRLSTAGEGRKRRLVGLLRDETGSIELVWFKGVHWLEKNLNIGGEYICLLYTSPSPRDKRQSRMPSSA